MLLVPFRQLGRKVIGALMLLLIAGAFAPQSAQAGCNHPAGSAGSWNVAHLDELITGPLANPSPVAPAPGRPLPCSGPTCSNKIPMPVSGAVLPMELSSLWGTLVDVIGLSASAGRLAREDKARLRPHREPSLIFHPPRASA